MDKISAVLRPAERAVLSICALYEDHGFKKYKISKFEDYGFFERYKNFLPGEHILSFTDLDGRLLALKPDITLSIIKHTRADASVSERLYYLESIYRESAEGGAFRETSQLGLEFLGPVDDFVLAETVALAAASLAAFTDKYWLEMGHMGFVTGLLDDIAPAHDCYFAILRCLRMKSLHELEVICRQGSLHPRDIADLRTLMSLAGPADEILVKATAIVRNQGMEDALRELAATKVASAQDGRHLGIDLTLINDTRYYNGLLLAGYLQDVPRQVLSGGRYDSMMSSLGKKAQGLGFAIYLDVLEDLMAPEREYDVDAVLFYGDDDETATVLEAVDQLTGRGLTVYPCRQLPPNLRYKICYRMVDRALQEVTSC